MKVKCLEVEPKGWGNNAIIVTPTDLQQRVWERTLMNMPTHRHGSLYRYKEILQIHQEVQGGTKIRSIDLVFA
jgi:hypothetical protein